MLTQPIRGSRGGGGPHGALCVDVELSRAAEAIDVPSGYRHVQALVRLHGEPLGIINLPVTGGRCRAVDVRKAALKNLGWPVIRHLVEDWLAAGLPPEGWSVRELPRIPHARVASQPVPSVTVAVCTRDRPHDLAICLESLMGLDPAPAEILVIDNAPTSDRARELVAERFARVRYIREPRPGLDWARNRAIAEATSDVIAFTDDDCVVDPNWVNAIATMFSDDPETMAVTGLVVPYELETEAQLLFERSGGFARGFGRQWFAVDRERGLPWQFCGAGQFGTGANMAYRKALFDQIGMFDPALDVGTVTGGGGDLDMFFRVLAEGHTLVYDPAAVVRHRHRRTYAELKRQIVGNGHGFCSFLVANTLGYRRERMRFVYMASWWTFQWQIKRILGSLVRPTRLPLRLVMSELWAGLTALFLYPRALRAAAALAKKFGPPEMAPRRGGIDWIRRRRGQAWVSPIAIRTVDIQQGIPDLKGIGAYEHVKVFVTWNERLIGSVTIANQHRPVSSRRVREEIARVLTPQILDYTREGALGSAWNSAESTILDSYGAADTPVLQERLPDNVVVSVVVATRDRPDDLRECLDGIVNQNTRRKVEVVVVDNNPKSGKTAPVVARFPGVRLIAETRKGLSYARNSGILAATGQVIVATDDDVVIPPFWLERLVGPFVRPDVMIVTGNVLPAELETDAQLHFETYGGLGRGFKDFEVDGEWFEGFGLSAAPTWELGATANAAFRASLFADPEIGLMEETLGAGMPTGCSEDTYTMYRALKAHHTLVYSPSAYLWHRHRSSMKALRRQIYGYSKGHVAYHLLTLFRHRDLRAVKRLVVDLPWWHVQQIWARSRQRSTYPISLVAFEMWGHFVGPVALLRSQLRVWRHGRSRPATAAVTEMPAEEPALSPADVESRSRAAV